MRRKHFCIFLGADGKKVGDGQFDCEASSPDEAAELFLSKHEIAGPKVLITWGVSGRKLFLSDGVGFSQKEIVAARKKKWENSLSRGLSLLANKTYLELEPVERQSLADLVLAIAGEFEKHSLSDIEIKFVNAWSNFTGRFVGESLLSSLEASRPKEERGKSPVINAALAVSALQYQKLDSISQDLHEIAGDVDTVSDLVQED